MGFNISCPIAVSQEATTKKAPGKKYSAKQIISQNAATNLQLYTY